MKTKQVFGYAAKLIKGDRGRFLLIFIGVILASVVISALFRLIRHMKPSSEIWAEWV